MNDNIASAWKLADAIDHREGMIAYQRYRKTMQRFASRYEHSLAEVTAAFCALSPNNDYMGNLRSLLTLLEGKRNNVEPKDLPVSTYNACKFRAWRFLNGEDFLAVTKGPKTRSFYQNILNPFDPQPVTIDGHMYSVWAGKRMRMKEVAWQKFDYEEVAQDFRDFAKITGVLPSQLQAILWFTWKRVHQVVYSAQMNLLNPDDNWGLIVDIDRLRPFRMGNVSA